MAAPWCLKQSESPSQLRQVQTDIVEAFDETGLGEHGADLWEFFSKGMSPMRLLCHPVFWSLHKKKCFVMDLADARQVLKSKSELPKPSEDWIKFARGSPLHGFLERQAGRNRKASRDGVRFAGDDIVDLIIFASNMVS